MCAALDHERRNRRSRFLSLDEIDRSVGRCERYAYPENTTEAFIENPLIAWQR
jgi:hypothetical protein